jgi:site-specific DNA-methyltransferase (adenine-specific)
VSDVFAYGQATLFRDDCLQWLDTCAERSIHAVVTDPPYGLVEYTDTQKAKLRSGRGGIWRIPPSYDGHKRSPLPRFTVLKKNDLQGLSDFFSDWAVALRPKLVPGAHVLIASHPLVSPYVSQALVKSGLERRGEIVRLVMTLRGGDRPKGAHKEFDGVTVMPRSQWEPWLLYREPIEARTVADNLRKWKTGGLRRISGRQPFGDVISSHPTRKIERKIADHPSLKPQSFLRRVVRAMLPLGEGTILDPFAGSGSTLAAAQAVGYESIGLEIDPVYFEMATTAIPALAELSLPEDMAGFNSSAPSATRAQRPSRRTK